MSLISGMQTFVKKNSPRSSGEATLGCIFQLAMWFLGGAGLLSLVGIDLGLTFATGCGGAIAIAVFASLIGIDFDERPERTPQEEREWNQERGKLEARIAAYKSLDLVSADYANEGTGDGWRTVAAIAGVAAIVGTAYATSSQQKQQSKKQQDAQRLADQQRLAAERNRQAQKQREQEALARQRQQRQQQQARAKRHQEAWERELRQRDEQDNTKWTGNGGGGIPMGDDLFD